MTDSSESAIDRGLDAIRDTFDGWVSDGKAAGMEGRHRRLAELMFERFDLPPDARVLDVGCGDGWLARMLADRLTSGAYVGIDISDGMVRTARSSCRHMDNALFAIAPAEQIPWAEEYFTHVVSIESAYYWPGISNAVRDIHRVTAPGGSFHILINYYSENPFSDGWDREAGLPMHRLSAEEWSNLFLQAGFEDVSATRIPDDSPIPPEKRERREGLQRIGALYLTGRKPARTENPEPFPQPAPNPFPLVG